MKVVVHIERLVLEGISHPLDLARLGAAVERELARSLTADAASAARQRSSERRAATARPVDLAQGPETIGRAIARAAHNQMAPARSVISRSRKQ